MFPIKLLETSEHNRNSELLSEYEISDSGYGKDNVKILHIERNGLKHIVREFEISTHLKLYTKKDFTRGDNSDIIATDSQKNTVYLLAKKYGIKCPEEFAIRLAEHFLTKYHHVKAVHIHVSTIPWKRIKYRDDKSHPHHKHHHHHHHHHRDSKHNHAFVHNPIATRFCDVFIKRHDSHPTVISGVKNLRILKTTQSSFENFINDEYRSLPDAADRVFSTNVRSSWQYTNINGINFNDIWHEVIKIILKTFAGNYESGKSSPSVQHTIYLAEHEILKCIKEIAVINIEMPNIHYILFDTKKHPKVIDDENKEVFQPVEKPSGIIFAQLRRKDILSKL